MRDVDFIQLERTVKAQNTRIEELHMALVQREQQIFSLWAVVSAMRETLIDKGAFTPEEYATVAKRQDEERNQNIHDLIEKRKAQQTEGEPDALNH